MIRDELYYSIRLHKLEQKDPSSNRRIINKLRRRIRQCQEVK